jgi:hypothetical protein
MNDLHAAGAIPQGRIASLQYFQSLMGRLSCPEVQGVWHPIEPERYCP